MTSATSPGIFLLLALTTLAAATHDGHHDLTGVQPHVAELTASEFETDAHNYWTWNWWQILAVAGGGAIIVGTIAACLWYRYRVVPRLIAQARREAYASRALSASTVDAIALAVPSAPPADAIGGRPAPLLPV
jgi:hypothetical protein